jgi:predicted nucleic acid-binding protein
VIVVPEIADYEVRRELLRLDRTASVRRLDLLRQTQGFVFAPVTTEVWLAAAGLWAEIRKTGQPMADRHALDADVILAATLLVRHANIDDAVVATDNVGHLTRFVPAARWQDIQS